MLVAPIPACSAMARIVVVWRDVRLLRLAPVLQEMVSNFNSHKVPGLPKSY